MWDEKLLSMSDHNFHAFPSRETLVCFGHRCPFLCGLGTRFLVKRFLYRSQALSRVYLNSLFRFLHLLVHCHLGHLGLRLVFKVLRYPAYPAITTLRHISQCVYLWEEGKIYGKSVEGSVVSIFWALKPWFCVRCKYLQKHDPSATFKRKVG